MTKKLLLVIAAVMACLTASAATSYGILVNGTSITSDNTSFSTGGGTVSYNSSTCTLTLNNVSFTSGTLGLPALGVYVSENRSSSTLKIVFNGTCYLKTLYDDVVALYDNAELTVNGTTSLVSDYAGRCGVRVYDNKDVTLSGSGHLHFNLSKGVALKAESTNSYLTFKIAVCDLEGKRGNILNFSRVYINPVGTSVTKSTTITLKPTSNTIYPHAYSIGAWYPGTDVHVASPSGYTFDHLTNAALNLLTFTITDERDNPNWTKVGNFLYSTYTESGVTYARLMGPTQAFKNTSPTTITVPGCVTLNGSKYQVRVAGSAFIGMDSVSVVRLEYGVKALEALSLSYMHKLNLVYIPSSVTYFGDSFLLGSGDQASRNSLHVYWATLTPTAGNIHSNAFKDCYASSRNIHLPTYPAITKAKSVPYMTNYFTVGATPLPSSAYDFNNGYQYYVVTNAGNATTNPTAALVGTMASTGSEVREMNINNYSIGYDYFLSRNIYCDNIAEQAFYNNNNVTSLTINSSDCSINKEAFYGCTVLKTVNINAKSIYERAFYGCTSLSTIGLNEGVQYVASQAFYNTPVTTLNIPSTLTTFAVTAVDKCKKLEKFTVASGNSNYSTHGSYGALYNKALTELVKVPAYNNYTAATHFPSTMTAVLPYAFSDNCRATSVELPYGVTSLGTSGGNVFLNATSIKSIKIPGSVGSIGYNNTFSGCTGLQKILISTYAGATSVNAYTFQGVPSTMRVYVPSTWNTLDDDSKAAYYSYDYWKNYNVTYGAWDVVIGGLPYLIANYTENGYPVAILVYGTNLLPNGTDYTLQASGSLSLPEKITVNGETHLTYVGPHAFENNTNLTGVTINQPLMGKGSQFRNCTGLRTVNFGTTRWARYSSIPMHSFQNTRITSIAIPYGCNGVGDLAFADNPSLTSVSVPSSCYYNGLAYVAANFVRNCSGLTKISLNVDKPDFMINGWATVKDVAPDNATTGCFYNVPRGCKVYVPAGEEDNFNNFTSPNGHKIWQYFNNSPEKGAYDYYSPGKGYMTFTGDIDDSNSDQMHTAKFVYAPNNTITVASMGTKSYETYDYIVTDLGHSCFSNGNLREIRINWDNVTMTAIPDYAFADCASLQPFPWEGAKKITRVGKGAFARAGVGSVVDMSHCAGSEFRLDDEAFYCATGATQYILPENTTFVGANAMAEKEYNSGVNYSTQTPTLQSVTCLATTVPQCGTSNPWHTAFQQRQTLYVPAGRESAYRSATYWKNFGTIRSTGGGIQGDVNGDGLVSGADVTALYNVLLDDATVNGNADVNGDGVVSGADVTALYNLLLN